MHGLRLYQKVEVLYAVEDKGSRSTSRVWWPGVVTQLQTTSKKKETVDAIQIRFQALKEFATRATTCSFTLKSPCQLKDRYGAVYSWRLEKEEDVDEIKTEDREQEYTDDAEDVVPSPTVSVQTGNLSNDPPYSPTNANKKQKVDTTSAKGAKKDEYNEEELVQLRREVTKLKNNLAVTHAQVLANSDALASQTGIPGGKDLLTPLTYLGCRLNEVLSKSPTIPAKFSHAEQNSALRFYSEETIRRQSDCSLVQLDGILAFITEKLKGNAHFTPSLSTIASNPPDRVEISFNTFSNFCKVFGAHEKDVHNSIVKTKVDRMLCIKSAVRVIGYCVQDSEDSEKEMFLTIGQSLKFDSTAGQIPILCREQCEWNELEGMHFASLKKEYCKVSDVISKIQSITGDDSFASIVEKSLFKVTWKRIWNTSVPSLFTTKEDRSNVLGYLEATIPYTLVRNHSVCEETLKAIGA